jgi:hypothetical protein
LGLTDREVELCSILLLSEHENDNIEEDEVGAGCRMHGGDEKCIQRFSYGMEETSKKTSMMTREKY